MNCRPGDLAYIVRPFEFEPAIGRVVTVVGSATAGHRTSCPDGGFIRFEPYAEDEGRCWLCSGWIPTPWGFSVPEIVIADACLRPIAGPRRDERRRARQPKQVTA